jgi:hypothetical protein
MPRHLARGGCLRREYFGQDDDAGRTLDIIFLKILSVGPAEGCAT